MMSSSATNCAPLALILLVGFGTGGVLAAEPPSGPRPWSQKNSAAFSPDGRALTVLDSTGLVHVWDVAAGKETRKINLALGRDEVAEQLHYAPNGHLGVLLCRYSGFKSEAGSKRRGTISACLWNLATGKRSPFIEIGYGGMAVCPKGELLAHDKGLWDVATGKKLHTVDLPRGIVLEIEFSSDGKTVLYQISEGLAEDFALLFLADTATAKKLVQIGEIDLKKAERCTYLFSPKFSPDGKRLAFSEEADPPALHLWDLAGGKSIHRIPLKELEELGGFSPDGRTLVSWNPTVGSVRLWETLTGKERHAVNVGRRVDAVLLSPDGKTVAVRKGKAVEFRGLRK